MHTDLTPDHARSTLQHQADLAKEAFHEAMDRLQAYDRLQVERQAASRLADTTAARAFIDQQQHAAQSSGTINHQSPGIGL